MRSEPRSSKAAALAALILGIVAFGGGCAVSASRRLNAPSKRPMPITVENLSEGRIRLERAGQRLVVDLARQISGCPIRTYDPTDGEEYESSVDFEIVDETVTAPYTYLVLLASAPPNCNVQGECGAGGTDATLIWLKVTKDLTLAGKQAFGFDDCRAGVVANIKTEPEDPSFITILAKDLPWVGDVLQIEYQEDRGKGQVHRLIYDRQNPGAGLQKDPSRAANPPAPAPSS